jgi:hypothetical protein
MVPPDAVVPDRVEFRKGSIISGGRNGKRKSK